MEIKRVALFNIADFSKKSRFSSLGLAYIASYLRKYTVPVQVYIIEGDGMNKLRKIKPDLIGIFSVTQTFREARSVAGLIKKVFPGTPIIIGGYHITALAHTLPSEFDLAVLGEGELTMKELIESIGNFGLVPDRLSRIKGIAFIHEGKIEITAPREFISNLDSIPFPARDLLINTPFSSMITSRGCPYKCVFCSSVRFWKQPRFHSPEYIISEMEELIGKFGSTHISIWDDLFIANRPRLEKISNQVVKNQINKKVSFGCALRSNLVNDELCFLLKQMNVQRVSIGFESGSQRILDLLKCGSVTVEDHINAVELCKKYGIFTTGTFMIGNPGETQADIEQTLALIKKLKLDGGGTITITAPFPGTDLWEYAKQKYLIRDDSQSLDLGVMSADFTQPESFKGVLLSDKIPKSDFFKSAQMLQKETNKYYIRGLLRFSNLNFKNLMYLFSRPRESIAIITYVFKYFARKSSIMERYVFYYKK